MSQYDLTGILPNKGHMYFFIRNLFEKSAWVLQGITLSCHADNKMEKFCTLNRLLD